MRVPARLIQFVNRVPLHLAIFILCAIWILPTLGLLVTSFRSKEAITETGWWTAFDPPAGENEYNTYCANCHGKNFNNTDVALNNPDVVSNYRRSSSLSGIYDEQYLMTVDGEEVQQIHVPTDHRPDRDQTAAILDYLRIESGLQEEPPRFTLRNYENVIVGYGGTGSYSDDCAEYNQQLDAIDEQCAAADDPEACRQSTPRPQRVENFTCQSFVDDLTKGNKNSSIFRSALNSLIVTIPATLLPILLAGFAAYAISAFDFNGRRVIFAALVGLQIIPLQMTLVPIFKLYNQIGLNGSFVGIWLFHTGFGLPYAIYLMRNFISRLPRDLFESAYLDGANHFKVFYKIVLPLALPAIAALAIFQFLWVWNDLLVALIFLGGKNPVLTYTLTNMDSLNLGWDRMTAAAFISILLPLIVFLAFQRYFVRGLLAGSVKG
jgi:alpha-glucoside transport system permease protein